MKKSAIAFISLIILLSACTDNTLENAAENNPSSNEDGLATIAYTDKPEQSYFLIKATDETIDGKAAIIDWSNQDIATKATSVSDGLSNTLELSKVVNDRWTFPAVQFALSLNEKEVKSANNEGFDWYLPSKNELMLMHIFGGCLNLSEYAYWSSTEWANSSVYRNNAWIIVPNSKMTSGASTLNKYKGFQMVEEIKKEGAAVRIVKRNDIDGKKYPYIKSKTEAIIVSRDKEGGVKESALRAEFPLTATTSLEDNSVSRCFEVDLQDAGYASLSEAKALSASKGKNWRVPTLRELQLIWAMGGCYSDWGAYVPQEGLNLRDVEGFVPLADASPNRGNNNAGEYLLSNPGSFFWKENNYMSEYRFVGSLGTVLGGNPQGSKQVVRLVRDVTID